MAQDEQFFRVFREINGQFSRLYSLLLNQEGLSLPQYSLLNLLSLRGPISMTEASELLSISKPAVTNIADQLEKEKLISRKQHPEDRRSLLLEILPRGLKKTEKIQDVIFIPLTQTLGLYQKKDRNLIYAFYEKLSENVNLKFTELTGQDRHA